MTHVGFKKLQAELEAKGNSSAKAADIAAAIGRRKYGAKRFQQMSAEGRRRASKKS